MYVDYLDKLLAKVVAVWFFGEASV